MTLLFYRRGKEGLGVEVNFETMATAATTGSIIGGVVLGWLNMTINSKLAKFQESLFEKMNGRYIQKALGDERFNTVNDRLLKVENKVDNYGHNR